MTASYITAVFMKIFFSKILTAEFLKNFSFQNYYVYGMHACVIKHIAQIIQEEEEISQQTGTTSSQQQQERISRHRTTSLTVCTVCYTVSYTTLPLLANNFISKLINICKVVKSYVCTHTHIVQ